MDWLDRVYAARDSLLSNPAFHRWAAAFPLTRPVARRRARAVFDLCAGFVYSQILLACVRLGLIERLRGGPQDLAQIARDCGLTPERARQLLEAATTLGLVMRRGKDRYGLGMHGAAILGNPGILRMIEHHDLLYRDLSDPVALLRGEVKDTALGRYWSYAESGDRKALGAADVEAYTTLMSGSQSLVAEEILDACPLDGFTTILDVGGGDGTFLEAVGRRYPKLQLTVFDLPPVVERAERRLTSANMGDRTRVFGGDFHRDALPTGADLVSLVRVLHDHSDDAAKKLLASVQRTLSPNGALLIAEPLAGTRGAETMGEAYFGFYLMAMGSGRPRTEAEIRDMLAAAGFSRSRRIATRLPLQTSVIIAHR